MLNVVFKIQTRRSVIGIEGDERKNENCLVYNAKLDQSNLSLTSFLSTLVNI